VYSQGLANQEATLPVNSVAATTTDEDMWAYTCSYDAGGEGSWVDLCSKGPYALNTTCRTTPRGAHIHLYYSEADSDEVNAKATFMGLATKALNLSVDICHDNYGHEQPHETTCWLGGPTQPPHLQSQTQGRPASSFVTSTFSLYVTNDDFAKVVSWVMLNDLSEVIGKSFDFLLHPVFGCNFADHQMWSLHKGSTPNNMFGIEEEGGWTGKSPSRLDPFGPEASANCACSNPSASSYTLHLLYDSGDKADVEGKDRLVGKIAKSFHEASVLFVKDVPRSFLDATSQFLAGQVEFKVNVESYVAVMEWLAMERGSTDTLMAPVTCCGGKWDYRESAIWAGRQWTLNLDALAEKNVSPVQSQSIDFLQAVQPMRTVKTNRDFLLYVSYASGNSFQSSAAENFISSFATVFRINRSSCTEQYPNPEPSYEKLCMMQEVDSPGTSDPITTAYAAVYVPAGDSARVLSWAMLHRSADRSSYQVDLLIVPLTGDAILDYGERAFHVGTPWGLNDAALLASNSSGETQALALPTAVHYYRDDNVDQYTETSNGATIRRWNFERDAQTDFPLAPPLMVRHELVAGATFPSWGGAFWFPGDSYSTVITGNATFGKDGKVYTYGDVFWAMAGHSHGPITNVGNTPLVVVTVSTSPLLARRSYGAPSDVNPSVDASHTTSRGYRRVDASWSPNPSKHSDECMVAGGVYNMGFEAVNNTPPVLRVRWAPNCSIPFHYHPTGAVYVVLYGQMFFTGDVSTGGSDVAFHAGNVRWVRPGFNYGPEYNSADEAMEITVFLTDTPPTFQQAPPGPYKYQRTSTVTAIFDEL